MTRHALWVTPIIARHRKTTLAGTLALAILCACLPGTVVSPNPFEAATQWRFFGHTVSALHFVQCLVTFILAIMLWGYARRQARSPYLLLWAMGWGIVAIGYCVRAFCGNSVGVDYTLCIVSMLSDTVLLLSLMALPLPLVTLVTRSNGQLRIRRSPASDLVIEDSRDEVLASPLSPAMFVLAVFTVAGTTITIYLAGPDRSLEGLSRASSLVSASVLAVVGVTIGSSFWKCLGEQLLAIFTVPAFLAYGVLQAWNLAELIHLEGIGVLFGMALVLKIPCALSLMMLAFTLDARELRDRRIEAEHLLSGTKDANARLTLLTDTAREQTIALQAQQRQYAEAERAIVAAHGLNDSVDIIVAVLANQQGHLTSALYFRVASDSSSPPASADTAGARYVEVSSSSPRSDLQLPTIVELVDDYQADALLTSPTALPAGTRIMPLLDGRVLAVSMVSSQAPAQFWSEDPALRFLLESLLHLAVSRELVSTASSVLVELQSSDKLDARLSRIEENLSSRLNCTCNIITLAEDYGEDDSLSTQRTDGNDISLRRNGLRQERLYVDYDMGAIPIEEPGSNKLLGEIVYDSRRQRCGDDSAPFHWLAMEQLHIATPLIGAIIQSSHRFSLLERKLTDTIHDLLSSVTSIRANLDWTNRNIGYIRTGHSIDELQKYTLVAFRSAESIREIVDRFKVATVRDMGMASSNPSSRSTPLINIFREVIDPVLSTHSRGSAARRYGLRARQVRSSTSWSGQTPRLRVSGPDLETVFRNLLDNAIKYRVDSEDVNIHVSDRQDGTGFLIDFADNGIGINAEDKERIFERHFRSASTIVQRIEGSGLGLFSARETMRRAGGEAFVSTLSNPTTITLRFPKEVAQ